MRQNAAQHAELLKRWVIAPGLPEMPCVLAEEFHIRPGDGHGRDACLLQHSLQVIFHSCYVSFCLGLVDPLELQIQLGG